MLKALLVTLSLLAGLSSQMYVAQQTTPLKFVGMPASSYCLGGDRAEAARKIRKTYPARRKGKSSCQEFRSPNSFLSRHTSA